MAHVDLPADSGLAAGMYVSGSFILASRAALVIPESALVWRDGNKYLMQVDVNRHVREIKVATGRRSDNAIELLGAVEPSAQFVKSGRAFINNGALWAHRLPTHC
jgi:HlyD family secretion protein